MNPAFDDFLAGHDRLSSLLKTLPTFEAPTDMEQTVIREVLNHQRLQLNSPPDPFAFEPPVRMESIFRSEAAKIDVAQENRRNALLHDIRMGAEPAIALGAPVSQEAENWLKNQTSMQEAKHQTAQTRQFFPRFSWRDIGLAVSTAAVAGLATHYYVQNSENQAYTAGSSYSSAGENKTISSHVASSIEPAAPLTESLPTDMQPKKTAGKDGPTPVSSALQKQKGLQSDSLKEIPQRKRAEPAAFDRAADQPAPTATQNAEVTTGATLPSAKLALAASPMPSVKEDKSVVSEVAAISAAPLVPSKQDQDANTVLRAVEAKPAAKPAAKSLRDTAPPIRPCLTVSVESDPIAIANHLNMTQCGQIVRLRTANIESRDAIEWVEKFRLALPQGRRPVALHLEKDAKIPLDFIGLDSQPGSED